MERVGAKEGDEANRDNWKILLRCGDPEWGETERRRSSGSLTKSRTCWHSIQFHLSYS